MFNKTRGFYTRLVLMLVMLGVVPFSTPVFAASITVDTVEDEDGTGTGCSLREAIKAANTDSAFGGCDTGSGADTITLREGTYTLTQGSQLPPVNTTITIEGNQATVQAANSKNQATYRVFEVTNSGDLTINKLTIQHGVCDTKCPSGNQPEQYGDGGGIYNSSGKLTLVDSVVKDNTATSNGGGIYSRSGLLTLRNTRLTSNSARDGGGIANGGAADIIVEKSIVSSNTASGAGGGIVSGNGKLTVTQSTFSGNSAGSGFGGGIHNGGTLNISRSSFDTNSAVRGGGLYTAGFTSTVANSTFAKNTASNFGGGIANYDNLNLLNSTLSENSANSRGGNFYSDPYQNQNDDGRLANVILKNTLLANSSSGNDCYNYVNGRKVDITGNNNLIETDSPSPNDCGTTAAIQGADPKLGTLGGSPQFYPLLAGSPAIDKGDKDTCEAAPVSNTSQNGVTRPKGSACDIGAFEYEADATPPPPPPAPAPVPGACASAPKPSDGQFASPDFARIWERTDKPIAEGKVTQARTWLWGPKPVTAAHKECYQESPEGMRLVQYFDKTRMEVNNPAKPQEVTNGLLVVEMIEGRIQVGDASFLDFTPAQQSVAGDPTEVNPTGPTYASFRNVAFPVNRDKAPQRVGQVAIAVLNRDGTVSEDANLSRYGVTIGRYDDTLGHNVPKVFTDFFAQRGIIYEGGSFREGAVIDAIFAMGLPISEPFWAKVKVAGVERDVLMQAFQRRVVTYTPSNSAGFQVEMGNVGQHYLRWRYGQ